MSNRKFFTQSLIVCAALALTVKWLAGRLSHASSAPGLKTHNEQNDAPVARRGSSGRCFDEIDRYVEKQMKRLNIPGASMAIVEGDTIVHQRCFGRAHPGGEAPTPQTTFFIGSLTKSITATAVMQLAEAGKIELDAPVQRYLPWFNVVPPRGRVADPQASANITVRHLLNQTSGLPVLPGMINLANFDSRADAGERQARDLSKLKLTRPVGSKWEYSNLNYNVLGLIIEAASGETYMDYIRTHIFNPLGMRHSYATKEEAKQNGLAVGHRHWFSLPFPARNMPVPRGSLASGQLISSTEDMGHYLIAHLNGGHYRDVQINSEVGMEELHRGAVQCNVGGTPALRYGMGWFDIDLGQTKTYSHSGNVPDFSAFMALLPEQKRGVVLLLNADPYGLPLVTKEVGMGLTAILAGQQPAPIQLDFIQWIMRLLPLIPVLQIVGLLATLRQLSDWRRVPELRLSGGRGWRQLILLPLIPNMALAAILVYLRSSGLLRFLQLFIPDLSWVVRISGGLAGIWALLRTGLMIGAFRKYRVAKLA